MKDTADIYNCNVGIPFIQTTHPRWQNSTAVESLRRESCYQASRTGVRATADWRHPGTELSTSLTLPYAAYLNPPTESKLCCLENFQLRPKQFCNHHATTLADICSFFAFRCVESSPINIGIKWHRSRQKTDFSRLKASKNSSIHIACVQHVDSMI